MSGTGPTTGQRLDFGTGLAGRTVWALAAQTLSSVTNFGVMVALAVVATTDEFGRLVAVFSVYLLALTLCRSLFTEPLVAADDKPVTAARLRSIRRAIWGAAGAAALGMTGVGLVVGVDRRAMVVLGCSLPLLLQQDTQRYVAWALDRPDIATAIDACWLGVSALLLGCSVALVDPLGPATVVVSYTAGGVTSWVVGQLLTNRLRANRLRANRLRANRLRANRLTVEGRPPGGSVRTSHALASRYQTLAVSQSVMVAAVNLGPVAVALLVSPGMAGATKALLLPYAAVLSLAAGARVVTLPLVRQAADAGRQRPIVLRLLTLTGLSALGAGAVSAALVSLVPDRLLGQSMVVIRPYMVLGAMMCLLYVIGQQLADAAALSGRPNVVGIRLTAVGVEWSAVLVGAWVAGVAGMAIGWTTGLTIATAIWFKAWLQTPTAP